MFHAIGRLRLLPRPLSLLTAMGVLFVAYVVPAGAMLLYAEHAVSARVSAVLFPLPWLADGIALSLLLVGGLRAWPAVFAGSLFIWGVMRGDPAVMVIADAMGEALSLVIAVQIMRAWRFRRQLDRLSDPLILIVAALAGRLVAALADIGGTLAAVWLTPRSLPPDYLQALTRPGTLTPAVTPVLIAAVARWQLNALAGIVLAAPVLLTSPRRLRRTVRARPFRLAILCGLSLLWCVGALEVSAPWACWPLLLSALMLVAWAAIDFSSVMSALCTVLFSCTAAAAFCQGVGPLATTDVTGDLAATWGFIGLLCCVSPVLVVTLSARQLYDRRLTVLANRYQSLFTANPTPAWVADAASGRILMANSEAIRRYGFSETEFQRMTIAELCADPPARAELPPADGDLVATPLVKHLTREGAVIDVELVSTPLELEGRSVDLVYAVDMTDHQDLRRRLLDTVDGESCRVSHELHEGLGETLTGLAGHAEALSHHAVEGESLDSPSVLRLHELSELAQRAESSLYQLTSGGPPRLEGPRAQPPPKSAPRSRARPSTGRASRREPRKLLPRSRASDLLVWALIVLACGVGGGATFALMSADGGHFTYGSLRIAVPSLLAGAAVSSLWLSGLHRWPAVLLGMALVHCGLVGGPLPTTLLIAVLTTGASYATVTLMRRWRFTPILERWQDPLVLCAAATVSWGLAIALTLAGSALLLALSPAGVAPDLAALFSSPTAGGMHPTAALFTVGARWLFAAAAGVVLVVPTLALAATPARVLRENLSELGAWGVCLAGGCLMLLALSTPRALLPLLTLSILLVVWATARFGAGLASLGTLSFAWAAAASFATRTGVLGTQNAALEITYVWGFVGVLSVISLFLAALLAQHEGRRREVTAVGKRYRSLFQGDPRPLWLHDVRTGQILDANRAAARAYGYSIAEFTALSVGQLLAPGQNRAVLDTPGNAAVGPQPMQHRSRSGESMDVEMWSYGTTLDRRRVTICFAHDVTERNALRRALFDKAELEQRQLAAQVRAVLGGPLAELRIVGHKLLLELGRSAAPARLRELLASLARQARRAGGSCREVAQRLSPLQASRGDLLGALSALRQDAAKHPQFALSVDGPAPLTLLPRQSEELFGLLSELLASCRESGAADVPQVTITSFGHAVRLSLEAELSSSAKERPASLARQPSVLLRARVMGARLWELSLGTRMRVVCDYPL
ncbi:MAG TPA: PAS domain S-box protein [Steroidobacteraceae bacterium]|nr:PAS domain S-box protein [Steroidobacteraceae bacterium]